MKKTLLVLFLGFHLMSYGQRAAVKTNLLYGAYALAPNLGAELRLNDYTTLDLGAGFNLWKKQGSASSNKKAVHWLVQGEYRNWLCESFNGHFWGIHALGAQYNVAEHKLPLLFGKDSKQYRYEGWAAGAGVSYGYQFVLSEFWNLELNLGVGYAYMKYDKFKCKNCGRRLGSESRNYFGPTKAGISIMYIIK